MQAATINYLIKKGSNAPTPNPRKVVLFKKPTGFEFYFKFHSNCLYDFNDPRYDNDINKLGGVSTNLSLSQSGARIGWNCGGKRMEELLEDPWISLRGYVEKNNKRVPTSNTINERLCRVRPELWYHGKGNFRLMTADEKVYYASIQGAESYTHVVDIVVNFDNQLTDIYNIQKLFSLPLVSEVIKGNQKITMPCPTPSSMGYYYFFPWFGGNAPEGCPHDINIEMIHIYSENIFQKISGDVYRACQDIKSYFRSLTQLEPGAA